LSVNAREESTGKSKNIKIKNEKGRLHKSEIDKMIAMAAKINAIVILDVQVGLSNIQTEIPLLEKYLILRLQPRDNLMKYESYLSPGQIETAKEIIKAPAVLHTGTGEKGGRYNRTGDEPF
jgi:molecular chaperone DnaK (HSP70)